MELQAASMGRAPRVATKRLRVAVAGGATVVGKRGGLIHMGRTATGGFAGLARFVMAPAALSMLWRIWWNCATLPELKASCITTKW